MAGVGQQQQRPVAGVSCAWPVSRGGTGKQRRAAAVQAARRARGRRRATAEWAGEQTGTQLGPAEGNMVFSPFI